MAQHERRLHGTRTKARKRALDILFEADLRGLDPVEALADHVGRAEPPVRPFTTALVQGVDKHVDELDRLIAESLTGAWTLERMPRVDRNLARLAIFELLYGDVAGEIAIDEAVTLSKELSTDESPTFLNGMLGRAWTTIKESKPDASRRPAEEVAAAADADDAVDDGELGETEATVIEHEDGPPQA